MKIKTIAIVLGMLLAVLSIRAQDIKPLSIGDKVPDLVLHNVINYKDSVIRLSDLKSKGVILDFFDTHCGSCIGALSRLEKMAQLYGDNLKIIVVCTESSAVIQHFIHSRPLDAYVHLLFITEDHILNQLFPHQILPHEVAMYHNKVAAITELSYLTPDRMQLLLSGQDMNAPIKKDITRNVDSLFAYKGDSSILLLPYVEGFSAGISSKTIPTEQKKVYSFINRSMLSLFAWALDKNVRDLLVDSSLRTELLRGNAPLFPWITQHAYCVQITTPLVTSETEAKSIMLRYLEKRFHIQYRDGILIPMSSKAT